MENREVIEWFKNRIAVMPESETKEMFRMAISALEFKERWMHHVRNRNGYCAWVRWRKNHDF